MKLISRELNVAITKYKYDISKLISVFVLLLQKYKLFLGSKLVSYWLQTLEMDKNTQQIAIQSNKISIIRQAKKTSIISVQK